MNMRQPTIIHEHYEPVPWATIIAELLTILVLVFRFGSAIKDERVEGVPLAIQIVIWGAPAILFIIVIIGVVISHLLGRNKPSIIVYNDRLEVRKTSFSPNMIEIKYSEIRNLDSDSGQLLIWKDEYSAPLRYNLGKNVKIADATFGIIRTTYDKYNQENNFKSVPIEDLPKKKASLPQVVLIVTMLAALTLFLILSK